MAGIHVFDQSVGLANSWVKTVMERLDTDDPQRALRALRVVLHVLRDQLETRDAVRFSAQLPMVLRGLYFDGWVPEGRAPGRGDVLGRIAAGFATEPETDPRRVASAVMAALAEHISIGELGQLAGALPAELREIWMSETKVVRPAAS